MEIKQWPMILAIIFFILLLILILAVILKPDLLYNLSSIVMSLMRTMMSSLPLA